MAKTNAQHQADWRVRQQAKLIEATRDREAAQAHARAEIARLKVEVAKMEALMAERFHKTELAKMEQLLKDQRGK